ncbi:CHAT domain-containing protein [Crassisporium funariophilum]|nr:CHAT domain-containing protein [Crassisporium funariophilum]
MSSANPPQLMMELVAKLTVTDENTLKRLATIVVGVCDDEDALFTGLRVILQVDNNEHWSQQQDLPRRRETMAALIHNLALDIKKRFDESDRARDLEIAITLHRKALELTPNTHSAYPYTITNLAEALEARHKLTGESADLDLVIALYSTLLATLDPMPSYLDKLGDALAKRYNKTRDPEDLDAVIELRKQVIELTPPPDVDHIHSLRGLAQVLRIRSRHRKQPHDLDDAIDLYRAANDPELMDAAGVNDTGRTECLDNLAEAVCSRFRLSEHTEDLEESIHLYALLVKRQAKSNSARGTSLSVLALLLEERFDRSGKADELDRAIALWLQLLELRRKQFEQTGQRKFLDDAVTFLREALQLVPNSQESRRTILNNLSMVLRARYEESKLQEDLREAIEVQREALALPGSSVKGRVSSLSNLIMALFSRYQPLAGQEADLEQMITLSQEALDLLDESDPLYSSLLSNYGNVLRLRFIEKRNPQDLTRAIEMLETAERALGQTHPQSCITSHNLGHALFDRYNIDEVSAHQDEGATALRRAATNEYAPISTRFIAARSWAELADLRNHTSALEAYHIAIDLLPNLAALNADLDNRQQRLMSGTTRPFGLAVAAAGCAIKAGKFEEAIELLEDGRAVFWNQALKLRLPLGELAVEHPALAARLAGIGRDLETGSFGKGKFEGKPSTAAALDGSNMLTDHRESTRLRQLNAEWQSAIAEIRLLPGFQDFLLPRRFSEFQTCALSGPIIILCVSIRGSNALVMTANEVKHLPLPDLREKEVLGLVRLVHSVKTSDSNRDKTSRSPLPEVETVCEEFPEYRAIMRNVRYGKKVVKVVKEESPSTEDVLKLVLEVLWVKVVEPVVRFIDSLPEIEDPITRPLVPKWSLHVSSNSCCRATIASLLGNEDVVPQPSNQPFKMLAVVQPETLPGSMQELRNIQKHVAPESLVKLGDTPSAPASVSEVLRHLSTASIVHFACHGRQYAGNPLESALMLEDGQLTVSRIMQQEMKNAQLAFLCACETGTGELSMMDESMHLGAALLAVGFRGVVATIWSIADRDGPKIADDFYGYLAKSKSMTVSRKQPSRMDPNEAARALHYAVQNLRSEGVPLKRWVPFIHLGR